MGECLTEFLYPRCHHLYNSASQSNDRTTAAPLLQCGVGKHPDAGQMVCRPAGVAASRTARARPDQALPSWVLDLSAGRSTARALGGAGRRGRVQQGGRQRHRGGLPCGRAGPVVRRAGGADRAAAGARGDRRQRPHAALRAAKGRPGDHRPGAAPRPAPGPVAAGARPSTCSTWSSTSSGRARRAGSRRGCCCSGARRPITTAPCQCARYGCRSLSWPR